MTLLMSFLLPPVVDMVVQHNVRRIWCRRFIPC